MAFERDKRYKKLFSDPVLIKQLLTTFVKEGFIQKLDFSKIERLDKSFVTDEFKEKEKWQFVASENFIFRNDFYTKTAALNLGLLAKQDIVVYGGYRIVKIKSKVKTLTNIKILDINKKKHSKHKKNCCC